MDNRVKIFLMALGLSLPVAAASLDDMLGNVSRDNKSMGMEPAQSTGTTRLGHDHHDHGTVIPALPVLAAPVDGMDSVPASSVVVPNPAPAPVDYGQLLADFHDRLTQDRDLLDRQLDKGGVSQSQYDADEKALNDITEAERAQTQAGNGSLAGDQVSALSRRLSDAHEEILRHLRS